MKNRLVVCALVAALSATSAASAQPGTAASAQTHYAIGNQLYATGRYAEAAAEFELAYRGSQRAELLFNLGRAREDAGQLELALDAYERFDHAGAPGYDRDALLMRIANLRQRMAARNAPAAVVAPPVVVRPPPPAVVAPPRPSYTAPIVLFAVGGAAVLGAVPLWVSAMSTFNELDAHCPMRQCTSQSDLDRRDSGQTRAIVGDVLGGIGLATLIAGGVTLGLTLGGSREAARPPAQQVTAWCTSTGCTAALVGTF